jgi:hypothetical protein
MATRIIEYGGDFQPHYSVVVPSDQFVTEQTALTATGTSQQSAAVSNDTTIVCVQSDEAVYVRVAANPTATTNSYRLQAGGEQFFKVSPRASWKVAVRT